MLSAYPTDKYYDPARPWWLPEWIDTPTESGVRWNWYPGVTSVKPLPDPTRPPAPPAPTEQDLTAWSPDQMMAQYREDWKKWEPFKNIDPYADNNSGSTLLWIAAALAAAGVLAMVRR